MPESPSRPSVTSDPDRGVAVNSATDPQRPGTPARPQPEPSDPAAAAAETSVPAGRFEATHETAATRGGDDLERGPRDGGDDPAE